MTIIYNNDNRQYTSLPDKSVTNQLVVSKWAGWLSRKLDNSGLDNLQTSQFADWEFLRINI